MKMREFTIGNRRIAPEAPCFIIAEAGVNHEGDLQRALAMIDVAAASGADAVKFQTFDPSALVTRDAPKAPYQLAHTAAGESQYEMLARLALSAGDHRALAARCAQRGILFMSTPFDDASADLLDELDVAVVKLPSGEITNLPFLSHVARLGRPLIVSTGMATLGEVESAVRAIEAAGDPPLALLHCVSNYPAAAHDINLRAMATMRAAFGVPVGYSDHSAGISVGIAAAALGASIIEKHFTLDRTLPGPDQQASLEPDELRAFVAGIRVATAALGHGRKEPAPSEASTAAVARKSLVARADIGAGAIISELQLCAKRPGTGLSPALRAHIVGRTARVPIAAGTIVGWEMLN